MPPARSQAKNWRGEVRKRKFPSRSYQGKENESPKQSQTNISRLKLRSGNHPIEEVPRKVPKRNISSKTKTSKRHFLSEGADHDNPQPKFPNWKSQAKHPRRKAQATDPKRTLPNGRSQTKIHKGMIPSGNLPAKIPNRKSH